MIPPYFSGIGTPLFEWRAPARRQQRLLAQ